MHWSKTRHADYEACPRRFFYSEIAAPRNPQIAELANQFGPPLVRHEVVRLAVSEIARTPTWTKAHLPKALLKAKSRLKAQIANQCDVNAQFSIVEACLANFVEELVPEIQGSQVLYVTDGNPVEFVYDGLNVWTLVELVLEEHDKVEIFNWKTGDSDWHKQDELRLRAGGLTCWSRSVLRQVTKPVVVSDVYLKEGPPPVMRYQIELEDHDVRNFVAKAKAMTQQYGASAKIADFPARPGWGKPCRFCLFKEVCFEYQAFAEPDYELATLENSLAAARANKEAALTSVGGEYRSVFLNHVSDDKDNIVRPFARALEAVSISFWLDEAEMRWGDSLTKSINMGLAISDYLVCFISENFLERGWPQGELAAALCAQMSDGIKRVLPIFIADETKVVNAFPLLRDIVHKKWSAGIPALIQELKDIVSTEREPA